ncbi:MAG: hypothetical protein Satyrvirus42_4 [Satyrvirus sp.]|uniref:U-box domain-containing protein n=1 Tax=Satyrvirus sp. TaxID=2487771 RepID=A0A3G5AF03_9VIRU|nr:MAG: hypothetical protein Satyrvirus42_4 [Satyrvirus sp.]
MDDILNKEQFTCPITLQIFRRPVLAEDGFFYEESEIKRWLSTNKISPKTRSPISDKVISCHMFNLLLQKFLEINPSEKNNQLKYNHTEHIEDINEIMVNLKFEKLLEYQNFSLVALYDNSSKTGSLIKRILEHTDNDIIKYVIDNIVISELECSTHTQKWRLIHYALRYSNPDIVEYVINKNIDLEAEDNENWRPIHYAFKYSTEKIIKILIEKGVNLNCETNNNLRPIHYACGLSRLDFIDILIDKIDKGAGLECKLIHFVLQECTASVIKHIIRKNINLDTGDQNMDYIRNLISNNKNLTGVEINEIEILIGLLRYQKLCKDEQKLKIIQSLVQIMIS